MSYEAVMGKINEVSAGMGTAGSNQNDPDWGVMLYGAPFVDVEPGAGVTPEQAAQEINSGGIVAGPGAASTLPWILGGVAVVGGVGLFLLKKFGSPLKNPGGRRWSSQRSRRAEPGPGEWSTRDRMQFVKRVGGKLSAYDVYYRQGPTKRDALWMGVVKRHSGSAGRSTNWTAHTLHGSVGQKKTRKEAAKLLPGW